MNNAALQAMIEEFGDRIYFIMFNNRSMVPIGFKSSPLKSAKDLQFRTFGGVDFVGVPKHPANTADLEKGITGVHWHATALVELVGVMDEACEKYRLDPWEFG